MKKFTFYIILSTITITSCASEKFNVSPLSNSLTQKGTKTGSLEDVLGGTMINNIYASEITNLIATFPKFKNDAVNIEVTKLKSELQNYLYAFEAYNIAGKHRALKSIQHSYKKIQKHRNKLNKDEDELLNRYLVKLKTNISQLDSASTNP